ncbi:MAG: 16S rRNA (cytosine(1402)-N(4))-methyltransferase RsmH [Desulfobulbus sp.]|jgi:16S rRNA (cytosine1402-N4)-methyltransferase|uniref:16S rRNA (cytosine(1402)-N(4))-methyltransferase RsmH n=1 Tax=Desulfobulbus sp. TaxID=895 RepID=UPI0028509B81|nr:16S rRNA (cytosine(1402)-N(4))-methyltransferase RsmH [Desulfobulbus sp.]MDR2548839.1 16S rRNA (cytosine(1402)-N(4))-methyltransferase RsmH [Desulfobulbus sp.]
MAHDQNEVHVPVLRDAVLNFLGLRPDGIYVDATLGLGGHAEAILRATPPVGRLIGFEWDADAAEMAARLLAGFGGRFELVRASYADLVPELDRLGVEGIDGLVADLGVSSLQLDRADRGFSFRSDNPLDMRMDRSRPTTAARLVAELSEEALADIFYYYGEERQARRIAKFLVRAREEEPVATTGRLAAVVAAAVPRKYHPPKVHVATKVFQALRIAVNGELENVTRLLAEAPVAMLPGARICIITFHSLEDRIVKQAFASNPAYAAISRRPIEPTGEEIGNNPRARSAKLRVAART